MAAVERSVLLSSVCPKYWLLWPAGIHTEVLKSVGRWAVCGRINRAFILCPRAFWRSQWVWEQRRFRDRGYLRFRKAVWWSATLKSLNENKQPCDKKEWSTMWANMGLKNREKQLVLSMEREIASEDLHEFYVVQHVQQWVWKRKDNLLQIPSYLKQLRQRLVLKGCMRTTWY